MKLIHLRGTCPDRISCPNVYLTDRGTYVVQGDAHATRSGTSATIEVPLSLLSEAAIEESADLTRTSNNTLLLQGTPVTDPTALAILQLPDGETAIEIAYDLLPVLEAAH